MPRPVIKAIQPDSTPVKVYVADNFPIKIVVQDPPILVHRRAA